MVLTPRSSSRESWECDHHDQPLGFRRYSKEVATTDTAEAPPSAAKLDAAKLDAYFVERPVMEFNAVLGRWFYTAVPNQPDFDEDTLQRMISTEAPGAGMSGVVLGAGTTTPTTTNMQRKTAAIEGLMMGRGSIREEDDLGGPVGRGGGGARPQVIGATTSFTSGTSSTRPTGDSGLQSGTSDRDQLERAAANLLRDAGKHQSPARNNADLYAAHALHAGYSSPVYSDGAGWASCGEEQSEGKAAGGAASSDESWSESSSSSSGGGSSSGSSSSDSEDGEGDDGGYQIRYNDFLGLRTEVREQILKEIDAEKISQIRSLILDLDRGAILKFHPEMTRDKVLSFCKFFGGAECGCLRFLKVTSWNNMVGSD
eukprot:g19206.t1